MRLFPRRYAAPVAAKVVAWGTDPLFYGSYAYYKLVARKADNILLSLPLNTDPRATKTQSEARRMMPIMSTRVYFAGEATSDTDM